MTPLNLQKALAAEMKTLFTGYKQPNQSSKASSFHIYENSTPILLDGQDEKDFFPYIVVRLTDGTVPENERETPTAKATILIGYFDENEENNGNKFVLSVIQRIIERFRKNTILDKYYNQTGNIEWAMADEDLFPYFFGGLELSFTLPTIFKESDFC